MVLIMLNDYNYIYHRLLVESQHNNFMFHLVEQWNSHFDLNSNDDFIIRHTHFDLNYYENVLSALEQIEIETESRNITNVDFGKHFFKPYF